MTEIDDNRWFLLKATKNGLIHLVGVMPRIPGEVDRAAFPVRIDVTVRYESNETGLPIYEDDLQALNNLEEDIRSWDPDCLIFRIAMQETGIGRRTWTLYATSEQAFVSLVPQNDLFEIHVTLDPDWCAVSNVLSGVRLEA